MEDEKMKEMSKMNEESNKYKCRYHVDEYEENEIVKIPKEFLRDWCDHIMTIYDEYNKLVTININRDLDDQILQLTKDIREYMIQVKLWSTWYDDKVLSKYNNIGE